MGLNTVLRYRAACDMYGELTMDKRFTLRVHVHANIFSTLFAAEKGTQMFKKVE